MTKEAALENLLLGYIVFDDNMNCYWTTWKAFHAGEETFMKATEAAKFLTEDRTKNHEPKRIY